MATKLKTCFCFAFSFLYIISQFMTKSICILNWPHLQNLLPKWLRQLLMLELMFLKLQRGDPRMLHFHQLWNEQLEINVWTREWFSRLVSKFWMYNSLWTGRLMLTLMLTMLKTLTPTHCCNRKETFLLTDNICSLSNLHAVLVPVINCVFVCCFLIPSMSDLYLCTWKFIHPGERTLETSCNWNTSTLVHLMTSQLSYFEANIYSKTYLIELNIKQTFWDSIWNSKWNISNWRHEGKSYFFTFTFFKAYFILHSLLGVDFDEEDGF